MKNTKERKDIPWKKIAELYTSGKSKSEISDSLGMTRKGNYPYYLVNGYLTKLAAGVEINGETIKIKRNHRSAKKAAKPAAKKNGKPKSTPKADKPVSSIAAKLGGGQ